MKDNTNPLISVIIPVYNVEAYLHHCIDSIIGQTYSNLEIILVNDGSTDRSEAICNDYQLKDPRITVIHQQNMGVSTARNKGLAHASGDFIGFVDADDYVSPNMYDYSLRFLLRTESDVAIWKMASSSKDLQCTPNCQHIVMDSTSATKKLLCQVIGGSSCNKLYRRSTIGNTRFPCISNGEDFVFNYSVFLNAKKIVSFDAKLYYYTQREKSASRGGLSFAAFALFEVLDELERIEKRRELSPYLRIRKAIFARNYLCDILRYNTNLQFYSVMRKYVLAARFTLFSRKWPIDKKFKLHLLLLWFCPFLYDYLIRKKYK